MALLSTPRQLRKGTSSLIMLTAWWLWKHKYEAIFNNARPLVTTLFDTIKAEVRSWVDAGARGLSQLLT